MRDSGASDSGSLDHNLVTANTRRFTAPALHRALSLAPTAKTLPWTRASRAVRDTRAHPAHALHHGHGTGEARPPSSRSPCPRHPVPSAVADWATGHAWNGRENGGSPLSTVFGQQKNTGQDIKRPCAHWGWAARKRCRHCVTPAVNQTLRRCAASRVNGTRRAYVAACGPSMSLNVALCQPDPTTAQTRLYHTDDLGARLQHPRTTLMGGQSSRTTPACHPGDVGCLWEHGWHP